MKYNLTDSIRDNSNNSPAQHVPPDTIYVTEGINMNDIALNS